MLYNRTSVFLSLLDPWISSLYSDVIAIYPMHPIPCTNTNHQYQREQQKKTVVLWLLLHCNTHSKDRQNYMLMWQVQGCSLLLNYIFWGGSSCLKKKEASVYVCISVGGFRADIFPREHKLLKSFGVTKKYLFKDIHYTIWLLFLVDFIFQSIFL